MVNAKLKKTKKDYFVFRNQLRKMRERQKWLIVLALIMFLGSIARVFVDLKQLNIFPISFFVLVVISHWESWRIDCPECSKPFCFNRGSFKGIRPWTTSCLHCGFKIKSFRGKYA